MAVNPELIKYIPIVKMIASTFGRHCEVVLHDLTIPTTSVVYVENNTVTGRMVGQSFDHLIKNVLMARDFFEDYRSNYQIPMEDGRIIKSSTCLLRNAENKVVGAICINFDITNICRVQEALDELTRLNLDSGQEPGEIETEKEKQNSLNVLEILDELIDRVLSEKQEGKTTRDERLEAIRFLNEKGVFLVKGSIEKVAEKMGVSQVTIYSYLDDIKKKDKN